MNNQIMVEDLLDKWSSGALTKEALANETGWNQTEVSIQTLLHRAALHTITSAAIQRQVTSVHNEFAAKALPTSGRIIPFRTSLYKWSGRIAASVLLIAGLFLGQQLFFAGNESLYNGFYQDYSQVTERSTSDFEINTLNEAFRNGEYGKVVSSFQGLKESNNREKFLTGFSYLKLNKPEEALQLFSTIEKQNRQQQTSLFEDEAEYYKAIAYLKTGKRTEALTILTSIKQNPQHTYYEAVTSWHLFRLKWSLF